MTTKKVPFGSEFFICNLCNYKSIRKSQYDRHILTSKHKNKVEYNQTLEKSSENSNNVYKYNCECGKSYPYRSSLYNHKKKCISIKNSENSIDSNKELINSDIESISESIIIKELKDIIVQQQNQINKQQTQISELIPKVGNNNTINNNQKFNIHVFLNEQCKDAINLSDFVKSLHVTLEQLDYTKQNGLADGISKTIIDNMSKLSIYERPMHCTDIKRETLYIKENDNWEKDNNKEKIKHAIKKTSSKNYDALVNWKTIKPDFMNNEDNSDYFTKTISTIGKSTDSIDEKVIKKLCKETYVKESI